MVVPVPENSVMSNQTALVEFVRKIRDRGGIHFNLILSRRKWNLHLAANQEGWAKDIAHAYAALDDAGFSDQVAGFRFDENTPLHGAPSSTALWDARHNGVLGALDELAGRIGGAAVQLRSVFIHGKGYGSQFKGVKASSDGMDFPQQMNARCLDYAYSFKWYQEGEPTNGTTLVDWENHFRDTSGFSEVHGLGRELVFAGDAGDGLRADILNTTTKATAIWKVFQQYGWSSTFFRAVPAPSGIWRAHHPPLLQRKQPV